MIDIYLKKIYNNTDAKEASKEINSLLNSYKSLVNDSNYSTTEKDVTLITYGDSISQKGSNPLHTLNFFLDKYIKVINTVHILPFYPFTSDDGFSVVDYQEVNKNVGTWGDVKNLGTNRRLMFDAVINHISQKSEWFQNYLNGKEEFNDFFIEVDPSTDLSQVTRPRALPLLTKFRNRRGDTKHIWTTFSDDQIDLNFANYKVLIKVIEVLLFYLSQGAKILRLDAIAFLWKEIGTTCIHHPKAHTIIKLMRYVLEQLAKDTVIITETNVPHKENISYFGNGSDEAHMVYNFTLPPLLAYSILKGNTSQLTKWARTLKLPSATTCFFNFTASHDGVGVRPLQGIIPQKDIDYLVVKAQENGGLVSYKNNPDGSKTPYELNCSYINLLSSKQLNDEEKISRMLVSQAIMLAMPGMPAIYIHSLLGSQNYYKGVEESGINRRINREKLKLEDIEKKLNNKNSISYKVFTELIRLIKARITEKLFNPYYSFKFPHINNKIFAIEKINPNNERLIALHNISSEDVAISLSFQKGLDIVHNKRLNIENITLAPYKILWIKVDN